MFSKFLRVTKKFQTEYIVYRYRTLGIYCVCLNFYKKICKKAKNADKNTCFLFSDLVYYLSVRELSSVGRATALQAVGHRFEPCSSHQ